MVSVVHSVAAQSDIEKSLTLLTAGLSPDDTRLFGEVAVAAAGHYEGKTLSSGEGAWEHALGMALIAAGLKLDRDARLAALLFAVPQFAAAGDKLAFERMAEQHGENVAQLVKGLTRLNTMRPVTRTVAAGALVSPQEMQAQVEILRKMLLAMVEDIRVVLLRLASRTQTLRYYAGQPEAPQRAQVAGETLEIYSPLANRLGVWELKWELEDLSFRFLHPEVYKRIAKQLDEKRLEREQFIADAIAQVQRELGELGIKAEVYGRPKHIYSIWNKMHRKRVDFSEVYDVRALRVIVDEVKDCYTVLGVVHHLWTPIAKEFDDYISNPKGNNYQSLHTAVRCPDGRSLEVQIRTWEMHKHAELGVAAHWRYKEGGKDGGKGGAAASYEEKIAWLRQILSWRDEASETSDWVSQYKRAALDETIYLLTPAGKVIDLPQGATAIDFAYRVHSDLGHRCRGAKVDGHLVPLNTALQTGQRVEIVATKQGGPSRDWLNPTLGFLTTKSARNKVRQWFAGLAHDELLAEGRAIIGRELQRIGHTNANIDDLAAKMGFAKSEDFFQATARGDVSLRQVQVALRGETAPPAEVDDPSKAIRRSRVSEDRQGVLIVGVDKLLTQLGRCCKPAPPEAISGFVTRGKGVSIHRVDCHTFAQMAALHPERVIEASWGSVSGGIFSVDIAVEASDRQGLLRDITDILARDKVNVTAVRTQSKQGRAFMGFTVEVENLTRLQKVLGQVREIHGVDVARRV
jgi:GTP pyrophosphokinase